MLQVQLVQQSGEEFAVLRLLNRFWRGADDWHTMALEICGEVERGLPAELDDDTVGLLLIADVEDVLQCQRLEEELVGCIVVGGDGFGVRVHHDRLVAELFQRECGVNAAVIEFNALADPVGAATEDDDFLFVRLPCLIFVSVGGVEIRRVGIKFRGASVNEAVGGDDAHRLALGADRILGRHVNHGGFGLGTWGSACGLIFFTMDGDIVDGLRGGTGLGNLTVRKSEFFSLPQIERGEVPALVGDLLKLAQKPGIDGRGFVHLVQSPALDKGGLQPEDALRVRDLELAGDLVFGGRVRLLVVEAEAPAASLERAQAFLHALFEGTADGHGLADGFH